MPTGMLDHLVKHPGGTLAGWVRSPTGSNCSAGGKVLGFLGLGEKSCTLMRMLGGPMLCPCSLDFF
jgi:hypothetical protein